MGGEKGGRRKHGDMGRTYGGRTARPRTRRTQLLESGRGGDQRHPVSGMQKVEWRRGREEKKEDWNWGMTIMGERDRRCRCLLRVEKE